MDAAISILEKSRQQVEARCARDLAEIDRAIARLKSGSAEDAGTPSTVTPGQWRGMKPAAALQACLNQRPHGAATLAEALRDLEIGEADLGQPDRHERNLKITLTNNLRTFDYNEEAGTVKLRKSRTA